MTHASDNPNTLADVDRRLAVAFGALILALMVAVLLAGGIYLRGVMEREENKLSTALTGVLANAVSHISFSGKYHARLLLQEIRTQQPDIGYLLIADPTGRVLAHSDPALNDTLLDPETRRIVREVLRQGHSQSRILSIEGKPIREVTFPYRGGYDNSIIGVIQVGLSEQSRDTALTNGLVFISALVAVLLAVGVAITLRISRHFGDPVKHLANELAATLHAIPDLLFELDRDGRYLQVLAQKKELLAASREQLLSHTVKEMLPADAAATVHQGLEEAATMGESHGLQIMLPLPMGACWFELSVARKEAERPGQPMRFIVLSRDITERKRVEEELRRFNDTLEQRVHEELAKNREKDLLLIQQSRLAAMGEMVHNIAHQWRQPLMALAIILANIRDSYKFGDLTEAELDSAVAQGTDLLRGMSTTIDDFRDFFRPEKEKGDFSVSRILREVEGIMGAALAQQGITLSDDIAEDVVAHGYDNEFAQVLLNLIANAKEAMGTNQDTPGRIGVHAETRDGMVEIRVVDSGGGIPEDVLPKIFDPYFTTKEKGTGIGLYMSKMIIEGNMGGNISARNVEGGAEILVRIPSGAQGNLSGRDVAPRH